MTFLTARNILISKNNNNIINNISLKIRPGELVGLIGPNGAGKTTLLKSLLGIVKPIEGGVYLNNLGINTLSRNYVSKHLGYLAQGAPCYWPVTVKQIVELGCLPHIYDTKKREGSISNIVAESMASTGISDFSSYGLSINSKINISNDFKININGSIKARSTSENTYISSLGVRFSTNYIF